MDRDTELKNNYFDMANLLERFKETRPRVDGNWYLLEKEGLYPCAMDLNDLECYRARRAGYIVTPVIMLRKSEIEDHEKNPNDS